MKNSQLALCGLLAVLSSSLCAQTPEDVAKARGYPVRYCAVTDTVEACQALIAELWPGAYRRALETRSVRGH